MLELTLGIIIGILLAILVLLLVQSNKKKAEQLIESPQQFYPERMRPSAYIAGLSDEEQTFRDSLPMDKEVKIL